MASKLKSTRPDGSRLDALAWTERALDVLADQGIDGVRVELLARDLGVTKGSFYWHFKDRDALLIAMLDAWRRRATLNLIARLDQNSDPRERLKRLLRLPFAGKKSERAADVELAIRLWGRRDPRAKSALSEIDKLRVEYISRLVEACGLRAHTAKSRAVLAYAYMRVNATLVDASDEELMAQCEAVLIGTGRQDMQYDNASSNEERVA